MLDIKNDNLFISGSLSAHSSSYGILKVLNHYDLEGTNVLMLCKNNGDTTLRMTHHIIYNMSNLKEIIETKLFRIDLIAIESDVDILSKIRKYTKLPVIILSNSSKSFNLKKYERVYSFESILTEAGNYKGLKGIRYKYSVKDVLLDGEYCDLNDIKTSRIRDIKIDSLFKKDN